jgi:hypothetical protein
MKKFQFPLGRVLDWRQTLARVEESKLERLYAELRAIESSEAALNAERSRTEESLRHAAGQPGSTIESFQLAAFDAFRRSVVIRLTQLEQHRADCARRIAAQIQEVARKRRDTKLLEHLKQNRLNAWTNEAAREIEMQAGELYLSKWRPQ